MDINKVVIHSLDQDQQTRILSENSLNLNKHRDVEKLVERLIKALQSSPASSKAVLSQESPWLRMVGSPIEFLKESHQIANAWFDFHRASMNSVNSNLIFAVADLGDSLTFAMFEMMSQEGYIRITENDMGLENSIIHNHAILPRTFSSVKNAFMIDLTTGETRIKVQNPEYKAFMESLLQCETIANSTSSFKVVDGLVGYLSEAREERPFLRSVKAKQIISENVDMYDEIEPKQILKEVFEDISVEEERLIDETLEAEHVSDMINLKTVNRSQSIRKHKIQTENGIEIILPIADLDVEGMVSVEKDINGKISIHLFDTGDLL